MLGRIAAFADFSLHIEVGVNFLHFASLGAIAMAGMEEGLRVLGSAGFMATEPFTEVPVSWEPVVFLRAPLV